MDACPYNHQMCGYWLTRSFMMMTAHKSLVVLLKFAIASCCVEYDDVFGPLGISAATIEPLAECNCAGDKLLKKLRSFLRAWHILHL